MTDDVADGDVADGDVADGDVADGGAGDGPGDGLDRVFLTGASGFIATRLAERLREDGVEVAGVDLEPDPPRDIVAGDTTEPAAWEEHLAGSDLLIHCAALVSFAGDADRFWHVNVLGTRRVLEAAARAGVPRVVHLSSIVAFGFEFPDGVDETWPVRTNGSPYVDTKVASEQVVLQAHAAGEIEATIVRPGDVYGPGSRPWTLEPIAQIEAGRALLPMQGRGVISPVYIDNLVDGIVAAATTDGAAGEVITLTDGVGVTAGDFFGRYAAMLGRQIRHLPRTVLRPVTRVIEAVDRARGRPAEVNPFTVDYLCRTGTYSIAKARRLLDWEPKVDLDEGFARTEEWLRDTGRI